MDAPSSSIQEFFDSRTIALVGASRDPGDFSRVVLRELRARGYDVLPVNPAAAEIEGLPCSPSVLALALRVEAALIMTPPARSAEVVRDCLAAGIRRVWLHQGAGPGAVSPEALRVAQEAGATVVPGECPLMYLQGAGFVHRLHRLLRRVFSRRAA